MLYVQVMVGTLTPSLHVYDTQYATSMNVLETFVIGTCVYDSCRLMLN